MTSSQGSPSEALTAGPAEERQARSRFVLALGAAAVAVALVVVALASTESANPVSGRALLDDPGARGQATLYRDHLTIRVSDLLPAPAAHHYEVWLQPARSSAMRSVGTLRPRRGAGSLQARYPGPGPFTAFVVSLDADRPPATRPGTAVIRATFG